MRNNTEPLTGSPAHGPDRGAPPPPKDEKRRQTIPFDHSIKMFMENDGLIWEPEEREKTMKEIRKFYERNPNLWPEWKEHL